MITFDGTKYIDHDEIGNPPRIYANYETYIGGYELTWEGRRLTAYTYFEESGNSVGEDEHQMLYSIVTLGGYLS